MSERFHPKDLAIPTTPDAQEIFIKSKEEMEKAKKAASREFKKIAKPNKKPRK